MIALDSGIITMIQRVGFLDLGTWFVSPETNKAWNSGGTRPPSPTRAGRDRPVASPSTLQPRAALNNHAWPKHLNWLSTNSFISRSARVLRIDRAPDHDRSVLAPAHRRLKFDLEWLFETERTNKSCSLAFLFQQRQIGDVVR
jgi:hypothetical protein